ncbi:MAG: endonuclease III [bacterium]
MNLKEKTKIIVELLLKKYPEAKTALSHENPLELLVATILSAQCTDERVNIVTKDLFKKYKTASDYAKANISIFENDIHSTGFYKNKAKNIINSTKIIEAKFNGKVPKTMEELVTLPGIGRKTANVVLGSAYGIISGIVVDTHVSRLSQRIGLTKNANPEKIELDLMDLLPKEHWIKFSHLLILHGRAICNAKKPKCKECMLLKLCNYEQKEV